MSAAARLGLRLLGPVSGAVDGVEFDPGPPRQRAVLAMLATSPGRVVTKDQLIDGLWGERPPSTAQQSVYTYVAGLRRVLEPRRDPGEPPGVLVGAAGGYQLLIDPGQVDAVSFARLAESARRSAESGARDAALRVYDQAFGLWRGSALSGVPGPFAEAERARLEDLYVTAAEERAAARIQLGLAHEAVPELRSLVERRPLRERSYELLVLALDACGRRTEALRAYEEARRRLDDEVGVGPGEGLRKAYALAGAETDDRGREEPPVPRQLPRDLIGFVGRPREIDRLRGLLTSGGHPLVVISGAPGSGKSVLAVHVAHALGRGFPGGQVFVNLRGGTPNMPRLTPQEIAARLLRAIGTPDQDVPSGFDETVQLWREKAGGRRLLVLLDDAADLAQVRWLLPVPPGVRVLVTSRESLSVGDGRVRLGRLADAEARAMLAGLAGEERLAADVPGTASLIRLCDGLPLALRIAGARLADRPDWTAGELAARLADERTRLSELEAGDLAVRSGLAASWAHLTNSDRAVDQAAARMLAVLGLVHVPDLSADAAARLAGVPEPEAVRALDRLRDAHLLERDARDRYQPHDLVRVFAAELPVQDAGESLTRVFRYFAASARLANVVIDPHRVQLARPVDGVTPREFAGQEDALAWLRREEHVLTAAAVQAMSSADDEIAAIGVLLTFALLWHQQRSHAGREMLALNTMALEVSERLGDHPSALIAHDNIANGLRLTGRSEQALVHLEAELELATRLGDAFGELRALGNLANAHVTGLRFAQALPYAERQLAVARNVDSPVGVRFALLMLGMANHGLGRLAEAEQPLRRFLADARTAGDTTHEALAHAVLGPILIELGNPELALEHLHITRTLFASGGYTFKVNTLLSLSRASRALGRLDDALDYATEARDLTRKYGYTSWQDRVETEHEAVREAMATAGRA